MTHFLLLLPSFLSSFFHVYAVEDLWRITSGVSIHTCSSQQETLSQPAYLSVHALLHTCETGMLPVPRSVLAPPTLSSPHPLCGLYSARCEEGKPVIPSMSNPSVQSDGPEGFSSFPSSPLPFRVLFLLLPLFAVVTFSLCD